LEVAQWSEDTQEYDIFTIHDWVFTSKRFGCSFVMAGPPCVKKIAVLLTLGKIISIQRRREHFLVANTFNDYGRLSLSGMVQNAGCCRLDDLDAIPGAAGVTLNFDFEMVYMILENVPTYPPDWNLIRAISITSGTRTCMISKV
jgi:hypothetical protein